MKKLKELLNGVNVGKVYGDTDREIGHIHFDSRKIEPGDVFIAQRGVNAELIYGLQIPPKLWG